MRGSNRLWPKKSDVNRIKATFHADTISLPTPKLTYKKPYLPFEAGVLEKFCLKYEETFGDKFEELVLVPAPLPVPDDAL